MRITITIILLIVLSAFSFGWFHKSSKAKSNTIQHTPQKQINSINAKETSKLRRQASFAKQFIKQSNFDSSFCFLIDMSLSANRNRFFIYSLKQDSIINSGLVTHGNCNQYWLEGRKYGNEVGCGCTSLGKYRIGSSYYGRFGLAFKLHGLDKTNSNAFKRYVVLHSHSCVPDKEVIEEICQSNGCPTVSPQFLKKLSAIIENAKQPVLLWIYE